MKSELDEKEPSLIAVPRWAAVAIALGGLAGVSVPTGTLWKMRDDLSDVRGDFAVVVEQNRTLDAGRAANASRIAALEIRAQTQGEHLAELKQAIKGAIEEGRLNQTRIEDWLRRIEAKVK